MKILISNKNIGRYYSIVDTLVAGISLFGPEVKSIKNSEAEINNSFVIFKNVEALILNFYIKKYKLDTILNLDEKRTRKLLLNKTEISKWSHRVKTEKLVVIPNNVFLNKEGLIKLTISLCKPLKKWDKREKEKKEDFKKERSKYI